MAILFDRNVKTISKHINNVFSEGEPGEENNTHYLSVDVVNWQKAMPSIKPWQNNAIRNLNSLLPSWAGLFMRIFKAKIIVVKIKIQKAVTFSTKLNIFVLK